MNGLNQLIVQSDGVLWEICFKQNEIVSIDYHSDTDDDIYPHLYDLFADGYTVSPDVVY